MMDDAKLCTLREDLRRDGASSEDWFGSCLELIAEVDRLRAEIKTLQLRPPMGCFTCEGHNDQLVERIDRMCEAVCAECAAKIAFVDAQKWPLPPREEETSEKGQEP